MSPLDASNTVFATRLLLNRLGAERLTRVMDVGANPLTPPPYADLLANKGCEVWGFEPQEQAYQELQETKGELERYFPYAVGDGSEITLNIYQNSGLTSSFKPYEGAFTFLGRSRRNIRLKQEVTFPTTRLDDMDEIEDFDCLKIDIQGGEVAVFNGAVEKLKAATVVIPELRFYPIYEGEPMLGGVDESLRSMGFQLHKMMFEKVKVVPSSQIDRLRRTAVRNQLLDGDGVYIRDLGQVDRDYSDEQLKHLALLAHSVFESYDIVLFCLDKLVAREAIPDDLPAAYVDALPKNLRRD